MTLSVESTTSTLTLRAGPRLLAVYVFRPDLPAGESPKPYFHPINSLSGVCVTDFRPDDHPWHKGLQMTLTDVSGHNFWGGPTYDADTSDYVWRPNLGTQEHDRFESCTVTASTIELSQSLTWRTADDDILLHEHREMVIFGVTHSTWAIEISSRICNPLDQPLVLGSPATLGRAGVGYSGLFLRAPRSWAGSTVDVAPPRPLDVMGCGAAWTAIAGPRGAPQQATVLFLAPPTPHSERWFARSQPYPALASSPTFATASTLSPGETTSFSHRLVMASGHATGEELAALADEYGWAHAR